MTDAEAANVRRRVGNASANNTRTVDQTERMEGEVRISELRAAEPQPIWIGKGQGSARDWQTNTGYHRLMFLHRSEVPPA